MPFFNSSDKYGNLYIKFKIVFPSKLTEEQKKKLNEILKEEKINIIDDTTTTSAIIKPLLFNFIIPP